MTLTEILANTNIFQISDEEFYKLFPDGEFKYSDEIQELFKQALIDRDAERVETLIIIMNAGGLDNRYSNILCELLKVDWHDRHEDIIMALKGIRDPETIDCIYETSLTHPDYDDGFSLQKKCIWAFRAIGTPKAIDKIKLLAQSDNFIVREFAELNLRD